MNPILVVDDAAVIRSYYRQILSGAGYQVAEADNGIDALETALAQPCSLCIVDVNMPRLDGFAFLEALRREPVAQPPALVITTDSGAVTAARCRLSGASAYLPKPVRPETLLHHVALLTGGRA
ncbi:response regulator [Sphingomonas changnyeongensis]|uniref:Response regulator n=1 Tax=Sphingomonas changnyeongensis TaxID=2698679 RepID=A0A7Z2S4U0_9SPHN|nr:response regulator [Sphingomonas changnyeongensis]QHL89638.1 response regulator [Sphingomonas changnyeongensis]